MASFRRAAGPKSLVGAGAGMVVAGSPDAVEAGTHILEEGGNAADAAIATALALCVTDPANVSIAGRCHVLVCTAGGEGSAIDGATQAPGAPSAGAVPVPGLPAALAALGRQHGRLEAKAWFEPASILAREGFAVPEQLARLWRRWQRDLVRDAGARAHLLTPEGRVPPPHRRFFQPALADFLDRMGEHGPEQFYVDEAVIARGPWQAEDLAAYEALPGEILRAPLAPGELLTIGAQGWGHTLLQLLGLLERLPEDLSDPVAAIEQIAHAAAIVLEDRPEEIGTLTPKPDGIPLSRLIDPGFLDERAAMVRERLAAGPTRRDVAPWKMTAMADQDTTHLSVVDSEGLVVSMTCSIGPHFGARQAHPDLGFLYPFSYRMRHAFEPGMRDVTEMTPAIWLEGGVPRLAAGGAGSERIPLAVAQVLRHRLRHELSLRDSVEGPRITIKDGRLRLWNKAPPRLMRELGRRGWAVHCAGPGPLDHVGIVHAAERQADGQLAGAADPAYDGISGLAADAID